MRVPARKIRPVRGRNYRCKISRSKSLGITHSESLLERDYVRLCNFDPTIKEIHFQPIGIRFHYKGRKRRYFPDYLVITNDNGYVLVEVKLKKFVDTNLNKAKFLAAKQLCSEKGWNFQVVTEDQIRPGYLQRNIKLLLEVKCFELTPSVSEYIKTIINYHGPLSVMELREVCKIVDASLVMRNLFKLIYAQEVCTELIEQQLTDNSLLWVPQFRGS
ncbi:TnsA endonuclease N-terminal domain-containing protein [Paenibacillus filicis]|uniref:TnsA endonuclease N-terminal domain-containing protein n=1 Tax=Paenibacillus gyeongsangnamensis TaxID=3388067 RepID=A0ABT4QBV7_9BACL|nr:TnsA endonuclease N-terminal domain-containing protein [Paenibacillus filicis]MCZ8514346.1 TnsA endonuclease N-terminal domain-containing protein [Paenibacillus filicis]